jgi:hypothetical protein
VFVQPSSLIFLVIIGIWAAYLLQHWVRRREHLATARSVDRFSDAMRVLERRSPLPESNLSAPQPRSYDVSPARPSRSEVVVKRAQTQTSIPVTTRPAAAVRSTRVFHALAGMSARRFRGLSLLASLSLAVVVSLLAAFSVLLWWSVPVVFAALVADLAWLRHAAMAAGAAGRVGAPARRSVATPAGSASHSATRPAAGYSAHTDPVVVAPVVGAAESLAEVADPAEAPAEVDLSGWAPVPVPPPTYTLKAKAERPVRVPAVVTEPAPAQGPSFDGLVDEGELDGLLDRRRA